MREKYVSTYDPELPYTVYCKDCWWSDKWDPLKYGRDFDFNRPFFEQFNELMLEVPKAGMLHLENENSEFNSLLAYSKNTYMSPGSYFLEDCYYCRKSQYCKDCVNNLNIDHCELVSNSSNSANCYNAHYLTNCSNCSDSYFLADCIGCKHCFMCSGLKNQEYCIKNKPISKEEYETKVSEMLRRNSDELKSEFNQFNKRIPKKHQNKINCQNSSGDYIQNCKNATECYDCYDLEDCKYMTDCVAVKDSMDVSIHDKDIELCYELCSGGESNKNLKFTFCSCASPNSEYLFSCFFLADSFGCDGFHSKKSYCIFNKQYEKQEFENLKNKIIQHMKRTGEYGEFFPALLSPFAYNSSLAQQFFLLSREDVLIKGWKWCDHKVPSQKVSKVIPSSRLPDQTEQIPDDILNWTIECKACQKKYRIISQELKLLRKINIPLSPLCPVCRNNELNSDKNPRRLWSRQCNQCSTDIQTTYSPEQPEKVLCEECYLKKLY